MRSYGIRILIFILTVCLAFPVMGASAADNAVSIALSCDGDTYYSGEISVRVAVSKPTVPLAGIEFTLGYNPDFVSPVITESTEEGGEMNSLVSVSPKDWEQMSYHTEGLYHFRFALPDSGDSLLDTAEELILEIPFVIRSAGSFDFVVSDADIIAIGADADFTPMSGTGSSINVVADSEAQKLSVDLVGSDTASEKGTYKMDITATNLGDPNGIIAVEFELVYDKSVFTPVVTDNSSAQMDSFMSDMPGEWEQMCTLDQSAGKYILRFAAVHGESNTDAEKLTSGNSFTVSVPFKVIGAEGVIGNFSVSSVSIIGINTINGIITGSGSSKSVSVEKAAAVPIPEDLGYEIKDGHLLYASEKTDISDFLAPLSDSLYLQSNGETVTEGYVCTGHLLTDGNGFALTVIVLGDANRDGVVDKYDYILIKRHCMGTFTLDQTSLLASDVDANGSLDKYDYILLKRHCMGTININDMER